MKNNLKQCTQFHNNRVNNYKRNTNWNNYLQQTSDQDCFFNKIHEKFSEIYKKSIKKEINIKKRSLNPWITEDIVKECDIRDKLFRKWHNNRKNKIYEHEYKSLRNKITKQINFNRNNYYKNKFTENRNDIRATWQVINELIGKKNYEYRCFFNKNF